MTNDQVIHLWASGSVSEGKNEKGTIRFLDGLLFSYQTVIANRVTENFVLITSRHYSPTTAKHVARARRAVRTATIIEVPDVQPLRHEDNLDWFQRRYAEVASSISRKRSEWATMDALEDVGNIALQAEDYAENYGLPKPVFPNLDELKAIAAGRVEAHIKAQEEREAAAIVHEEDQRTRWLAGEAVRPPQHGGICLRVKPTDAAVLETSWGAEVPLSDAIRVFRMVQKCMVTGHAVLLNLRVGHFTVDRIDSDGTLCAGCHSIKWTEIERLAVKLGLV